MLFLLSFVIFVCCRSTPELGHTPREGLLRKTQSQSHGKKDRSQTPPGGFAGLDSNKYSRCRSVPTPPTKGHIEHGCHGDLGSKLSCPNSPTEDKDFDQEKFSKLTSFCNNPNVNDPSKNSSFGGFKSSLTKSKSDTSAGTGNISELVHDGDFRTSINNGADGATNHSTSSDNNEEESAPVSLTAS